MKIKPNHQFFFGRVFPLNFGFVSRSIPFTAPFRLPLPMTVGDMAANGMVLPDAYGWKSTGVIKWDLFWGNQAMQICGHTLGGFPL